MNKFLITAIFLFPAISAVAQQPRQLTDQDYAHAESFLYYGTAPLIDHGSVNPVWLPGDRFWFRDLNPQGSEFILVDPVKKTRTPAFDQQKLAEALSTATGHHYDAYKLPFQFFSFSTDNNAITFKAGNKSWKYDLPSGQLVQDNADVPEPAKATGRRRARSLLAGGVPSPDGKKVAFIRNYNLWIRDLGTSHETQLTMDGIKDYGYATDNAGWKHSDDPILSWSPDSKKIATFQQDQRKASDMYLVTTNVGKPTLKQWKYAFPGDSNIITIERVIINVDEPKVIRLQIPADPHRASLSDDIASSGSFDDVDWSPDGSQLAFLSTSRDHKQEKFRIADTQTGAVREVFEENVPTQYESGWDAINWHYLAKTNEIIWFSERDNWGHLYLYDAATGKMKNQITKGEWVVTKLDYVDEKNVRCILR